MLNYLLKLVIGSNNDRFLKKCKPMVSAINALEETLTKLDDQAIRARFKALKDLIDENSNLSDYIIECFALVREASKRTIGLRHHDVQLIGGIALHEGNICEMATGEGKTLVATLPIVLNAMTGHGVHLVTVNSYLAERDASWMGNIYQFLGLSVGMVIPNMSQEEKQAAYACDITYGSNNEFAFDFLRDNMATTKEGKVQRKLQFALIDEVDQIFIEEARTPLIISGPIGKSSEMYATIYPLVDQLFADSKNHKPHAKIKKKHLGHICAALKNAVAEAEPHATINIKEKQVELTEAGHEKIEALLHEHQILPEDQNLYDNHHAQLLHYIDACLRAKFILTKDIDYIIHGQEIVIIDEHTGRAMKGRRWSSGHHQAVEAKEHVTIQEENQTLASITFQNYFRLYDKLAGMTGTADTEATEFEEIYNLQVIVIPTNKKCLRIEDNDIIYMTKKEKYQAIVDEIKARNAKKQPLLVGTTSIEDSEYLSTLLKKHHIKHRVLNAKQHAQEAEIIEQAGKPGCVTIATNMAGRGTDIVLGGNPEAALQQASPEEAEAITAAWKKEQAIVKEAGGLHVLGTERHESRRVDNQLKGRCARQGDPGSCQFFLSLEDHLFRIFPQGVLNFIKSSSSKPGESLQAGMLNSAIASNQQKMEAHYFDIRKQVLKYDNIANEQRLAVYQQRNDLLDMASIHDEILPMIETVLRKLLLNAQSDIDKENPASSIASLLTKKFRYPVDQKLLTKLTAEKYPSAIESTAKHNLCQQIASFYFHAYEQTTEIMPSDQRDMIEKSLLLQTIDQHWKEHLLTIEDLRESIGFRSYAQKNPEHEYKIEAHTLFKNMLDRVKETFIVQIINIEIRQEPERSDKTPQQQVGNRMLTPFD